MTRRFCDWWLRLAAPIVPGDVRQDWLREWRAELVLADGRSWHALGALPHAVWLRWDRWRFEMLAQDLKHAIRSLTKKPGFATITLLTLGIGIGANAAIFGAVRAVLLRPLPFEKPEALVAISTTTLKRPDVIGGASAPPDVVDWQRDITSLTNIAAISADSSALTGDGPAEQVPNANVSGTFFNLLGVSPLYGRGLAPEDDVTTAPDVAVLSHALWVRRFGSRPDAIGRTVTADGKPLRIVGVMPAEFSYPLGAELWLPIKFTERDIQTQRGAQYLDVIGRLKPGATIESAQSEMRTYGRHLGEVYPRTNADRTVRLSMLRDSLVGSVRPAMLMLLGAVGFVLLIVCVNVANLFLTRALGRQREMAVRSALGASRGRLVRALLVESGLVGIGGGMIGLVLAMWGTGAIAGLDRGIGIPLLNQTRVDGTVMLFVAGAAMLTAILFGTLPAWQASSVLDVAKRIREDATSTTGDRHRQRLRSLLIVFETAMAVVLLVGAGLLMRSFVGLTSVELGFSGDRVQTFNLSLPQPKYPTPVSRAMFAETLMSRLAALPQTESAGAIFGLPLTNFAYTISMSTIDGRKIDNDEEQNQKSLQVRVVTPDYFKTMGIPIRRGRSIQDSDRLGGEYSVVINETAAARLWPDQDPLGHQFTLGTRLGQGGASAGGTVVGVAGDVHDFGPVPKVRPTVYLSHAQFPINFFSVVIKTRGEPTAAIEPARAIVAALDPDLPMFQVRTMGRLAGQAVAQPRLYLLLLAMFAAAAMLLSAIGIYGVLSHTVSQRTREIGIRLALGAARGRVVRSVVGHATLLALSGLAAGLVIAAASGRFIQGLLFGVQPIDLPTYVSVATGLALVAVLASWIPARRASRVDPVVALRQN